MTPPSSWESPFLEAYGNYIIAQAGSASLFQTILPLEAQMDHLRFLRHYCISDLPHELGGFLLDDVDEALKGSGSPKSPTCE